MIKNKLIRARKEKKFSQQDVAEFLSISQTQYLRKEKGEIGITEQEWDKIAKLLNVEVEEIKEEENGTLDQAYTKKEASLLRKEMNKLSKNIGGIKNMHKLPAALFVVDIKKEFLALEEAKKLGIPIVALIDTNVDPDLVDFKIPANDDAIRSVKLFAQVIANAVVEANGVTEGSTEAPVEEQLAEVATETVSN